MRVATVPKDIPADDKESRNEDLSRVIFLESVNYHYSFGTFTFAIRL
jgi:hypothetical protein